MAKNKDFKHGPFGYTNHACRCDICTEGNRVRNKSNRESRYNNREQHKDGYMYNPYANHGTTTGYQSYGCRCPACTKASTDARGNYKRNR